MARTRSWIALAVLLLLAALAVPGDAANREHQQMMADIRMLQEQTQRLQLQIAALGDVLKAVTAKLDEQANVNRKAFADSKLLIDTMAGEVRVVREKVDDNNVRLTSLAQEMEALRNSVPQAAPPAIAPPATGDQTTAGTPAGTAPATPPTVPPPSAGISPQRLFDTAWADYTAGQWTLAIEGFETYLKTFPKSELADDAQYYIGETYWQSGKFREAVAAYDKLVTDYPGSNRIPEAYYHRGLALNSLGQGQQARESFEFVVKNYPESDAGRLAKQALDRLNRIRDEH